MQAMGTQRTSYRVAHMAGVLTLFLFGDQTHDRQPHQRQLLTRPRDDAVLEELLAKAYDALRTELFQLPREAWARLPRFTSIDDVLAWTPEPGGGPGCCVALEMAVTCLCQLGVFVSRRAAAGGRREGEAEGGSEGGSEGGNEGGSEGGGEGGVVCVGGLCTGAFAAAAVACSSVGSMHVVPLGVAAVVAAFRTGMRARDAAQRLHPGESSGGSGWAAMLAPAQGESAESAVEAFGSQTVRTSWGC